MTDERPKTVPFSGKKEDYMIWSARFLSYAHLKQCKGVITGKEVIPDASAVLDETTQADLIKARKANDLAYNMLSLAVTDPVSFGAVNNGITDELPDGDSSLAWTNLESIFKPTSDAAKNELEQKFNQCALTQDSKNPDEWFAELEQIRLHLKLDFSVEYDEDKMITHVVYNTKPQIYETVLALIKRDIGKDKGSITLSSIKEDFRQVYQTAIINKTIKVTQEKVLNSTEKKKKGKFKKVFKGDCRICGKKGHKGDDCWDNEKNKDK